MSISYTVYDSYKNLDVRAWEYVKENSTSGSVLGMDPDFLLSIENSMSKYSRLWYVIFYSDTGVPIASACLSTLVVDLAILSSAAVRRVITMLRRVIPSFFYMKILFCGTPVSLGQIGILFTRGAAKEAVLIELDNILLSVAEKYKAKVIVHKECESDDLGNMLPLYDMGYKRADSLDMHIFSESFVNFTDYLAGLNSHYRYDIKRSLKKMDRYNVRIKRYSSTQQICELYTDRLYAMYLAVVSRSESQLEVLPKKFFIELTNRFTAGISLTVLEKNGEIMAYNWSLNHHGNYHFLFCGIDYENNKKYDLYFNIMYAELGFALEARPDNIYVGQTASIFKMRLGCKQESLYLFVKPHGFMFKIIFSVLFRYLFPPKPNLNVPAIFNSTYGSDMGQ